MELWIGAVNLGFLYAFMTLGVFITFRIYDFPDITVDGSFTTGAAVAAVMITAGFNPFLSIIAAFVAASLAGVITALIHTRLNIHGLLAGILVMTGLYSINLHVMGRSNIPLLNKTTLFFYLEHFNPGIHEEIWICLCLILLMVIFWLVISLFFKTDFGLTMRVTGNNPSMAGANGVNVNMMKVFGIALANGFAGISGGLVAQYQGFADIGMGIGTILIGLASVIIGEAIFRKRSIYIKVMCVIIGSVVFRLMIAFALYVGMNPIDLKLLTAAFVLLTLIVSNSIPGVGDFGAGLAALLRKTGKQKKYIFGIGAAVVIVLAFSLVFMEKGKDQVEYRKKIHIGFIQVTDNGLLNVTRDAFLEEMKKIGYNDNNCKITLEDANGDLATVSNIIDKFISNKVDIIVPVSTPCTQAAVNKVKDIPVVFATVANPFIVGAGKSDTDHLPNVTGVYGWTPMGKTLEILRKVFPGKITIGTIWDPSHANSVFQINLLKAAVKAHDGVTLVGTTIANSSEIYQAAVSLAVKGIDTFILPPDNTVYSAFDSVVKAAKAKKIPIMLNDTARLADGALLTYGHDFTISGIQAAHLVDRVLKGENPGKIPFERYKKTVLGLNEKTADELGIKIPSEIMSRVTRIVKKDGTVIKKDGNRIMHVSAKSHDLEKEKKLAVFMFNNNQLMIGAADGLINELKKSGILEQHNITMDIKNAQNEFSLAQSVAQDIVRKRYDYIITLSTPALQVTASVNKKIPHVFGLVTDPYRMGIAKNNEDHIPNITGIATLQPVESTIKVMRELFPDSKTIGLVWNPGEACSETCTYKARDAAEKYGFKLIEINVTNTAEVLEAVKATVNKDADLFLTSGDNTVSLAVQSIAEVLRHHKIPYFTNTPSDVNIGAFLSIGADYVEVGKETAKYAQLVINGKDPKDMPIKDFVPETMYINYKLAQELGFEIPKKFLNKAAKVLR